MNTHKSRKSCLYITHVSGSLTINKFYRLCSGCVRLLPGLIGCWGLLFSLPVFGQLVDFAVQAGGIYADYSESIAVDALGNTQPLM